MNCSENDLTYVHIYICAGQHQYIEHQPRYADLDPFTYLTIESRLSVASLFSLARRLSVDIIRELFQRDISADLRAAIFYVVAICTVAFTKGARARITII